MRESEIRPAALHNSWLELVQCDGKRLLADRAAFVQVPCPACESREVTPGLEKFGFHYAVCARCGTLYVSPRPRSERLDAFYQEAESVRFWSDRFYRETQEARREKMFRPRALLVDEWAQRVPDLAGRTFVDVGSGFGVMLEEVRTLWKDAEIIGVEPNPSLAQSCRARGFRIIEKPVEAVALGECAATIATSFEVLEHVHDPLAFLAATRRLLRPGGLLLLTTLTVSGFDIQVLWERAKAICPPLHLNFVSVAGMRRLVSRAGYELVELTTPGQLDVDIVANALAEDPAVPLPRFVTTLLSSSDEAARREFQVFLCRNLLSSHIRVIARA